MPYVKRRGDSYTYPVPDTSPLLRDPAFVRCTSDGTPLDDGKSEDNAVEELQRIIDDLRSKDTVMKAQVLEGDLAAAADKNATLQAEVERLTAEHAKLLGQAQNMRSMLADGQNGPQTEPSAPPAEQPDAQAAFEKAKQEIDAVFAEAGDDKKSVETWVLDRYGFNLDLRANMAKLKEKTYDLAREKLGLKAA